MNELYPHPETVSVWDGAKELGTQITKKDELPEVRSFFRECREI